MHRFIFILVLLSAPALFGGAAHAQPNGEPPTAYDTLPEADAIPPGFRPVKGAPDVAKIDANPLVVGAYATFFLGIFGYVVYLARRQTEIAREMEALAEQIRKVDRA